MPVLAAVALLGVVRRRTELGTRVLALLAAYRFVPAAALTIRTVVR